jgi:hypothetical protein
MKTENNLKIGLVFEIVISKTVCKRSNEEFLLSPIMWKPPMTRCTNFWTCLPHESRGDEDKFPDSFLTPRSKAPPRRCHVSYVMHIGKLIDVPSSPRRRVGTISRLFACDPLLALVRRGKGAYEIFTDAFVLVAVFVGLERWDNLYILYIIFLVIFFFAGDEGELGEHSEQSAEGRPDEWVPVSDNS